MIKSFNTYIEGIPLEFWRDLCREEGVFKKVDRGEYFLCEGDVCKYLGYIEKGSFKYVTHTKEGDEKIVGLETVGGFVANWPYCLQKLPSKLSIIASTNSEISCLPVSKIIKMMEVDGNFEKLVNLATREMFYTIYERMIDIYTKTPKERYGDLLQKCPTIFEIFDLKDIASYLNITPVHMSRIRKEEKNP
ncbi:MAG: Crp/Fnr family transcriptional regulator [Muribaculaceae bacterium]|nr:Crp/Fnr family transcriptional regulator [Muribaculaceae bacterium]